MALEVSSYETKEWWLSGGACGASSGSSWTLLALLRISETSLVPEDQVPEDVRTLHIAQPFPDGPQQLRRLLFRQRGDLSVLKTPKWERYCVVLEVYQCCILQC